MQDLDESLIISLFQTILDRNVFETCSNFAQVSKQINDVIKKIRFTFKIKDKVLDIEYRANWQLQTLEKDMLDYNANNPRRNYQEFSVDNYFLWSAKFGFTNLTQYLMTEANANINARGTNSRNALMHALTEGYFGTAFYLFQEGIDFRSDSFGRTPLCAAVGNLTLVKGFLKYGENINQKGSEGTNALICSINGNCFETTKYLIENGADINQTGYKRETALMAASLSNDIPTLELLIKNESDIDKRDQCGRTALFYAVKNKNLEACKFLIENDAYINETTEKDRTPLMYAARNNNLEIIKFLIEKGANIDSEDENGNNALSYASKENKEIIQLLTK